MVPDQFKSPPNKASLPATLLFLPGTLCDERLWEAQHQVLSNDWSCAFADYRFDESIVAMAATALDQAPGPVIPIGLSMGGVVALEIWRQAPERVVAMALFDTNPGPDTRDRFALRAAQSRAAAQSGLGAMVASQLLPSYFSARRPTNASLCDTVVAMANEQGSAAYIAQSAALATRLDAWSILKGIDVPVLVACGIDDRICPLELHQRMATLLPKATLRPIADSGHLAPLEQPEVTTQVLVTWLKSLDANNT